MKKQKSGVIWVVALFFIGLIMVITNPTKQDYVTFVKEQIINEAHGNVLVTGITSLVGQPLIENTTSTKNLVFFSLFKTNFAGSELLSLGIFNNFFPIKETSSGSKDQQVNPSDKVTTAITSNKANLNKTNDYNQNNNPVTKEKSENIPMSPWDGDRIYPSSKRPGWSVYKNGRYGFSIEYPDKLKPGRGPDNGDGFAFISGDGKSDLIVYGSNNLGYDLHEVIKLATNNIDGQILYQASGETWFVISWKDKSEIRHYQKTFLGPGSENTFILTFPEEDKAYYEEVLEIMEDNFRRGDINSSH